MSSETLVTSVTSQKSESAAVLERVHVLASKVLGIAREELSVDATLSELGVDSLDVAELMLDLEQAFELKVSDEHAARLRTLRDVAAFVVAGGVLPAATEAATEPASGAESSPASTPPPAASLRPMRGRVTSSGDDERIVITGLGAITPLGSDPGTMFRALLEGRSGVAPCTVDLPADFKVRIAAQARGFDPVEVLGTRGTRRFGRYALMAVAAARQAIEAAGLRSAGYAPERTGVMLGVGIGGLEVLDEASSVLHGKGPRYVPARGIIGLIPNMAAGLIAQDFGARGPCFTTASACASGGHALGEALNALRLGHVDAVIAGGAEACITPLAIACFAQIGALSRLNENPALASRPFDRERDGFVIGEGAGVLVLERYESARRRGAHIHAELAGYGASADAYHPVEPDPDGRGASLAMSSALADAGVNPGEVAYVNAHGTSTPYNDRVETLALKRSFGAHAGQLWVSSTKSMMGHLLGAAGAVEAIVCAQVVEHGRVPPTINLHTPDPDCDLDYVPNTARERQVRVALSNSFAFGGQNACLVLRAV
ncbi:MAG TPA: beta-ketoacyl-ACP synthase II [Polyangiales bacterium]|nr:beta-ketoacyl-ACP synthase II [Polyangiales bacterium]